MNKPKKNNIILDQIRDRTPKELLTRKNEFLKICKILDDLKVNYFLQTGILLGAIRDKDLIPWDWDIEISVFSDGFDKKIDAVSKRLIKNRFRIKKIIRKKKELKIDFIGKYPQNVTGYTIFAWNYSKIRDCYWRKNFIVSAKYLNKYSQIKFFGRKFNCPYNPEEYLTYAYGNWRKPLRTKNKEVYFTKNFLDKKRLLFNNIKINLKKFLYDIIYK